VGKDIIMVSDYGYKVTVSDHQIRYCDDQIMYYLDLVKGQKYVIVNGRATRRIIEVKYLSQSANGRFLRYDVLDEHLKVVRAVCSSYLTDLGVQGYEYRGRITWNIQNYVRKLRSTDHISDTTLRTASRLLMLPSHVQGNLKIKQRST